MNLKNIILALSFIIPFHIHTMDKPIDLEKNETPQESIFYLAKLPGDIWDLIAQYLTFSDRESQEEFIKRTKIKITKTPKPYDKHLPQNEWESGCNSLLIGYCPNNTKVALLRSLSVRSRSTLTIIDEKNDKALYNKSLDHKDYKYIALSSCAHMFATIHWEEYYYDEEAIYHKHKIIIKNITSPNIQEFDPSDNFRPSLIAFNKQGTHIILHGTDSLQTKNMVFALGDDDTQEFMPHHLIFPVTVNINNPENGVLTEDMIKDRNTLASQKTLQHYFHQKGICKSIIQ